MPGTGIDTLCLVAVALRACVTLWRSGVDEVEFGIVVFVFVEVGIGIGIGMAALVVATELVPVDLFRGWPLPSLSKTLPVPVPLPFESGLGLQARELPLSTVLGSVFLRLRCTGK